MTFRFQVSCPVFLLLTCGALADQVRGQVLLANGSRAKNAVVWLEGGPRSSPLSHAVIDQRDLTFIPHVSVVTVGTTVRFPNNDTVYHNVFAEFEAKRFDLGMYARGATKTKTFDKKGVVALMCSVHSNMSAYIMVVDTPYYAVADSHGRFSIKNVPNGSYQLRVWHESNQSVAQQITVSPSTGELAISTKR